MLSFEITRRKARRRSVSVGLSWCSGRITQIQVCGILFGIMRTEAFFYYLSITYIWEVMEPRAFEKCQMHFSTNQDDDGDNSDNDTNRT